MKVRYVSIVASILILIGCSTPLKGNNTSPAPTHSATINAIKSPSLVTSRINHSDYKKIATIALKTNFKKEWSKSDTANPMTYPLKVSGVFDLNSDNSAESLNFLFLGYSNNRDAIIQINDIKQKFFFENPYDVLIVDLDGNDIFKEIAVKDDGPSGDPQVLFFRYTGKEIIHLGTIHDDVMSNSNGKLITSWESLPLDNNFVFSIYEVRNNSLLKISTNYSEMLNKYYKFSGEFFFQEMNKAPIQTYSPDYRSPTTKFFPDEKFKLIDIKVSDGVPRWYYIERSNKTKGIMYFWLGD